MAKISTHVADCFQILGKGYPEVHEWLDHFAKKYNPYLYLEKHRQYRHHAEGVKEVGKKWGHYAEQAAKIHLIRDQELYIGYIEWKILREDDIEDLYQKALKYCLPAVPYNNIE